MTFGYTNDLKHLLHPFILVLKEGKIDENPLDFSLMIVQITCPEVIKSPTCTLSTVKPLTPTPELDISKTSLADVVLQK
jgi:hypothetical protein